MTSWEKWKPFLDPEILTFLLGGLWLTLQVAVASVILSIIFGTVLAMLRLAKLPLVAWPAMAYVETVRSLPSFLVLIYVFFGVNRLGFKLPPEAAVVVGLTAYSAAKVAEIVRAGIQSIEKGQIEASRSLGLSYLQTMRYVVLPQAFRRMVPPLVGELVIVIKNTSIGVAVGLNELLRRGQITYQEFLNPVETLVVVAFLYFILCYSLSLFGRWLERDPATEAVAVQAIGGAGGSRLWGFRRAELKPE